MSLKSLVVSGAEARQLEIESGKALSEQSSMRHARWEPAVPRMFRHPDGRRLYSIPMRDVSGTDVRVIVLVLASSAEQARVLAAKYGFSRSWLLDWPRRVYPASVLESQERRR
mgnify:FL=1